MPILYFPNDPEARGQRAPRTIRPSRNRAAGRAGFAFGTMPKAQPWPADSDAFLRWQCREALLRAVSAWEKIAGPLRRWQHGTRLRVDADIGEELNAYYDRESVGYAHQRSAKNGRLRRFAASVDVVAHEAGHAFLGEQNREAMLRICPLVEVEGKNRAAQYNIEYRAGDATSNPWLYLGCIIRAGLEGIRNGLPAPRVLDVEVDALTPEERVAAGVRTLPASLDEALEALVEDDVVTGWFDSEMLDTFLAIKREEIAQAKGRSDADICAAYRDVY